MWSKEDATGREMHHESNLPVALRSGPRNDPLLHGVPEHALSLADELSEIVEREGAEPALIGVYRGIPTVGLTREELREMVEAGEVAKVNTANLGVALFRKTHGATTVATTMEPAAQAGVRVFATGGMGACTATTDSDSISVEIWQP